MSDFDDEEVGAASYEVRDASDKLAWAGVGADLFDIGMETAAIRALDRFVAAYQEYGEDSGKDETGLAGQWADLFRKIKKLKAPMWEGDDSRLKRESTEEVLCDLIGHALLALQMLRGGVEGGRTPKS